MSDKSPRAKIIAISESEKSTDSRMPAEFFDALSTVLESAEKEASQVDLLSPETIKAQEAANKTDIADNGKTPDHE